MTSNSTSDHQHLLVGEEDNPPTYQEVTSQSYGTFISPSASAHDSPYSQAFGPSQPAVVILGGCPACKVGMLDTEYTCGGLCCAICCFPVGILCCLAMRQRRCNFCEAIFD